MNIHIKRVYYIRYVDHLVVGVVGSRQDIIKIYNIIKTFLKNELNLMLTHKNTAIAHLSKNCIFFLGIFIERSLNLKKRIISVKKKDGVFIKTKMMSSIVMNVPIKTIFEKGTLSGFFKKRGDKFIPTNRSRYTNLSHQDIIHYYNSIINGILNYYSFVNNRKCLSSLVYGLRLSCARTLALKYKLRYASKVYKRFGSKLLIHSDTVTLSIRSIFKITKKTHL